MIAERRSQGKGLTLKLLDWHALQRSPDLLPENRLDIRAGAAFAAGHLCGAASLPVPDGAGDDRALAEALPAVLLPPRHEALLVCGASPDAVGRVVDFLGRRGRARVHGAVLDGAGAPEGMWIAGGEGAVLWRPPAFLAEHVSLLPPPDAGPVVDLGCGGGRAAVWLAGRGYDVTGIDHLEDALAVARRLARRSGVEPEWLRRDLSDPARVPAGPWAAALCFRYLERDLLRRLPDLLLPGGVAVVRTFRWIADDARLPRRRYCLERGELLDIFPAPSWEILRHVEDREDDGRPAAGVVARLL